VLADTSATTGDYTRRWALRFRFLAVVATVLLAALTATLVTKTTARAVTATVGRLVVQGPAGAEPAGP